MERQAEGALRGSDGLRMGRCVGFWRDFGGVGRAMLPESSEEDFQQLEFLDSGGFQA